MINTQNEKVNVCIISYLKYWQLLLDTPKNFRSIDVCKWINNPSLSWSLEGELLVGSEESDELRKDLNTDGTSLVDIEVSPGSWEIGGKVFFSLGGGHFLVGGKNFSGGSSGLGFSHGEDTVWRSILVLSFSGVVHDHWSHEEVIRSISELDWENSLVFLVEWSGTVISGLEEVSSDGDGGSGGDNSG